MPIEEEVFAIERAISSVRKPRQGRTWRRQEGAVLTDEET